ncbi:MAG: hypothetical protein ACK54F_14465, partial [Planctomycetia bacterium]
MGTPSRRIGSRRQTPTLPRQIGRLFAAVYNVDSPGDFRDMNHPHLPKTLAELRASGWKSRPVKDEVRENFLRMLRDGSELFPGIVGYDDTVIPEVINAVRAGHDMLFLG